MYSITEPLLLGIWIWEVWINAYCYLVYLLTQNELNALNVTCMIFSQFVSSSPKFIKGYL